MAFNSNDEESARVWAVLYERLESILGRFGKEDFIGRADYWLLDDDWGCGQHMLYINNLALLAPSIVKLLQASLAEFPKWEIVVAVSVEGTEKPWPPMGLHIRAHEIIDDLRREYFPKEFQGIAYEGSRRGEG
jgi:hypothetical protein